MGHDNTRDRPLHLAFDLAQLQNLGALIYQTVESALLELVARSYEAGATNVAIRVSLPRSGRHTVTLKSDVGMSDDQLESLADVGSPLVGYPNPHRVWHTSNLRHYGNLACFAIGKSLKVATCRKGGGTVSRFAIDLGKLEKLERQHRAVCTSRITKSRCGIEECWTVIEITKVRAGEKLTPATLDILAANLAQRLMFADPDFTVTMSVSGASRTTVSNSSWRDVVIKSTRLNLPNGTLLPSPVCRHWAKIRGSVDVSGVVLSHTSPGIRLVVEDRAANKPEFFGADVPVTFTSRTSGLLRVDFVAKIRGALKPGDPPTIDWTHPEMRKLRGDLSTVVHNIHFLWTERCEDATRTLLGEEIESEWFRELPFSKQGDLLRSLLSMEHDDKGRIIDHALRIIGKLMAPHPKREWRLLHEDITSNKNIMDLYNNGKYYPAVAECIKLYCEKVRKISGAKHQDSEGGLMQSVLGGIEGKPGRIVLSAADGKTGRSIQKGHSLLSQGLIYGIKNPAISHGSQTKMEEYGLFTEDDCLDILSLVSYLFRRIENRKYPPPKK